MFVMYEKENMRFPVRVWLKERGSLEKSCMEQAYHLSRLPFLHKWVSLMPDTHAGMGMPIGGVIAAEHGLAGKCDVAAALCEDGLDHIHLGA